MIENPTVGMLVKSNHLNGYARIHSREIGIIVQVGLVGRYYTSYSHPIAVAFKSRIQEGIFARDELEVVSNPSAEDLKWHEEWKDDQNRQQHADRYL